MKNKLSLSFPDTKKNLKRTGVSLFLAATLLAFFAFAPLPFLHIP